MERLSSVRDVIEQGNGSAPDSVFLMPVLYILHFILESRPEIAQWPALFINSVSPLILPLFC